MMNLLLEVMAETSLPITRFILGGFSQGSANLSLPLSQSTPFPPKKKANKKSLFWLWLSSMCVCVVCVVFYYVIIIALMFSLFLLSSLLFSLVHATMQSNLPPPPLLHSAMLSTDVALHLDQNPAALCIFSVHTYIHTHTHTHIYTPTHMHTHPHMHTLESHFIA